MIVMMGKGKSTLAPDASPDQPDLLLKAGIPQQNLLYFASLVDFYTIHYLRNLKTEQNWLYRMCYIWPRYRQLSDNLTSAMMWLMK